MSHKPSGRRRTLTKSGSAFFFAGTDGATSVKAEIVGRIPILRDASTFREARRMLTEQLGGTLALFEELARAGFVDRDTKKLTTGTRPFNVFARLASGVMVQQDMVPDQHLLGEYASKFTVCSNLKDNDDHWDSEDPAWKGKASMSRKHRFLTTKNLHWSAFNALTIGLVPEEEGGLSMQSGIRMLEEMKEAALTYTKKAEGWSDNVGLFLHVFGHCSVNSLHLHILDMNATGPTFLALNFKNCPLDAILKVLKEEAAAESSDQLLQSVSIAAGRAAEAAQAASRAVNMAVSNQHQDLIASAATNVIELNVGGQTITVERDTLMRAPEDSKLHRLAFADSADGIRDMYGRVFLEYPPRPFQYILNHLRMTRLVPGGYKWNSASAATVFEAEEVQELSELLGVDGMFQSRTFSGCCKRRPKGQPPKDIP